MRRAWTCRVKMTMKATPRKRPDWHTAAVTSVENKGYRASIDVLTLPQKPAVPGIRRTPRV